MQNLVTRLGVSISLACLLAACEPVFMLPGGALSGTVTAAPDDWSFTNTIDTVQIETRPSDPYSVNIWLISLNEAIYIHAGANRATWVEHLESDGTINVRVGEMIYPLHATRVTEQSEFDQFSDAYEQKYDRRPRNENVTEAYLFRLQVSS